jgi:GIY-YIG catalytic domain
LISLAPQKLTSYAANPRSVIYGLFCVCPDCLGSRGPQIRYVGTTVNGVEFRLYQHLKDARPGSASKGLSKSRWITKHGPENIRIVVIEEVENHADLNSREIYWIARYRTHRSEHGLNMTIGGDGVSGYVYSDAQRAEMSRRAKGRMPSDAAILSARTRLGTKSPFASSDEVTVERIKAELWRGVPPTLVAQEFGVSTNFINHVNNGRTWSHVPWPIGPREKTRTSELRVKRAAGRKKSPETIAKLGLAVSASWTPERTERQREILKASTGLRDWVQSDEGREANSRRNASLSDQQVREVRDLKARGVRNAEIGRIVGCTPTIVGRIVRGESYQFVR